MLRASDIKQEYDILNGALGLLKRYGDLRADSPEEDWNNLLLEAEKLTDGYDGIYRGFADAVTAAAVRHIADRSGIKGGYL